MLLLLVVVSLLWSTPRLNIKPNSTTVSGFSYGGDMAIQTHVAYSRTIRGACGFSAQPVYCAVQAWTREPTIFKTLPEARGVPFCDGCLDPLKTVTFDHCRVRFSAWFSCMVRYELRLRMPQRVTARVTVGPCAVVGMLSLTLPLVHHTTTAPPHHAGTPGVR